ncbi:signal peptidase I [Microcoleus sp. FACHB-1515]|uniref:signal peptidase I n=1 Tax=Cyanophyceae TaxID=3028117 RepID=UPI0016835709|nr:signal peptidase I [Microcoleus sp. FACHB-1515]MBD2093234.1 signal peptidase I [Microcoleus sp. FACHB-1515]
MSLPLRRSTRSSTQSSRSKLLRCWHEPLTMTVGGLLIAMGVRSAIASPVYIPSESMQPTLAVNDTLLTEKLSYHFHAPVRGDIVVFAAPTQTLAACHVAPGTRIDLIKRVVAVAGDHVAISSGQIFVNGQPLKEPYVQAQPNYEMTASTVPPQSVFVLGDNRNNSCDSHIWGALPVQAIEGRAILRFWPPARIGLLSQR